MRPFFVYNAMIQDELEQLLEPTLQDMGYVLWGCEYLAQGKHSLLRIYIDKEEGIDIDDCQQVSHQVSALLDVEDPIPGNYSLEVSSPGIPRPLFKNWQFELYVGHDVQIKTFKPIAGKRKLQGRIISVSSDTFVLNVHDEVHELFFSNVVKAYLAD
ncbi:MAG: ribosome maturation factor RimP [Legionella sp.]|nr:ribosome maturation factor RimP [Legionella sp.]